MVRNLNESSTPSDWRYDYLDKFAKRGSGHTPDKEIPEYWNGGIKWISLADSSKLDNGYIYETDKEISEEGIKNSSAVLHPQGTVVLSRDAGVGKSAVMSSPMAVSQHFIAWRCDNSEKINSWFLYNWLQLMKPEFERQAVGSTIKTIGLPYFKKLKIAAPPIAQQQKIAQILSSWDKAIEKLEALTAAKQKRKKALMQQLLTGKKRFAGFEGEWKTYHLSEIFSERNESGFNDLTLLSITREKGVIPRDEVERKDTSNDDKSKYLRICPGDIGYNTMRMWQGVSALSDLEGIVSPAYTICVPKNNIDAKYASFLFKTPVVMNLFLRYSQGLTSDTWNLKFRHFSEIKITIPEKAEQQKIAFVLSAADIEIETHQKQLSALKEQKKGLMQQLLTGKIRVKLDKEN
ncbi:MULTISPECIES: restriction endonuclease subunit S [Methylomonas]|uniref:Type I restriction modification DNA specificity domain-containing protein n=2 Tax=Methylomonas TaxID=416 RepID=A0A126T1H7_9GAMM|nr:MULTISPECIES: restriction endonuclease subunit S [Methylomonas]AMK75940.1 hypothetical protein JT25_005455 [Methylomonas denitrificans]OAI02044.1 hypothetical protein A1342_03665 [Methylomonas methanica]TCV84043.1 type I restriction enzyme S subunit [Methylomonas methanica]